MTENPPAAHTPWQQARQELRVTLRPEDGVFVPLGEGRTVDSVLLTYVWDAELAEKLGLSPEGWGYHEAAVMQHADDEYGPRRLHVLYDEDALNSPLGGVPDWVYRLFNANEPPAPGALVERIEGLANERDSLEQRLAEAHRQLLDTATVASAAVDTATLSAGVRGALRMLHDEASAAVSRQLTMAYAVGLAEGEKKARIELLASELDKET